MNILYLSFFIFNVQAYYRDNNKLKIETKHVSLHGADNISLLCTFNETIDKTNLSWTMLSYWNNYPKSENITLDLISTTNNSKYIEEKVSDTQYRLIILNFTTDDYLKFYACEYESEYMSVLVFNKKSSYYYFPKVIVKEEENYYLLF